jgi:hypothetical protein
MMAVEPIQVNLSRPRAVLIPAIRTPAQFENAEKRILELLDSMRSNALHIHFAEIAEIKNLREAIDASPFLKNGDRIVAKGFSPRFVS